MVTDNLHIVAFDPQEHLDAVAGLWSGLRGRVTSHLTDPYCDRDTSRVGLLDGRVTTFWGVFDIAMRIGTAHVRTAGVNWVATHSAFRKRGLMAQTGRSALLAMREGGYDLSLVNGIENYYERFGYVFAWPKTGFYVKTEALPADPPDFKLHEFTPEHREDRAELFNRQHAGLTGTAVRPTHRKFKWPGTYRGYGWTGEDGRVAGYLIGDGGPARGGYPFDCVDAAGDPEQILRVLGLLARKWRYTEIQFDRLHERSPLAARLRRIGCTFEAHYPPSGGYRVRIVNLPSLLERLVPELARRLRASHLAAWRGALLLACGKDCAVLALDRSNVRVVPPEQTGHAVRGGEEIAQLIVGTAPPEEIVAASGIELSGHARELIDILFPEQHPQMPVADL